MKYSEKNIKLFKSISLISGIFTLLIAFTMLFSLIQLKTIDPLDSPAVVSVKEQFDSDPGNKDKAEEVRAMDLMSRKAYFSSRWQVETGSYLLLAGAIVFILFQRLISENDKLIRSRLREKPDISSERVKNRRYLVISAGVVTLGAVVSSFILRSELPAPGRSSTAEGSSGEPVAEVVLTQPDGVNYPFFRGEGSRGIAGGSGYPTEWNGEDGKNIKWKISVPSQGKNSPVIWGDKLFFTGAKDNNLEVYCIDKNKGDILWTGSGSDFPGASEDVPESDVEAGMAVPTAAVNENGVIAIFGNGNLVCFDLDGKLIWGKNIGVPKNNYGFTSSLVIYNDILIVQYDSDEKLAMEGYDIKTGEKKWETPRTGRQVNSSPVLAVFNGQPQVLINGNPNVSSYDPVSGAELWTLPGVSGDVATSLAVNSTLVYTASDYFKVIALKPGKDGSSVWEDNTFTPDVSSPVATDEYLFVTTGNGDAACYNAQKGDTVWSHYFENPFYASPVVCDNKVWMLDRSGIMHVVKVDSKFELIATSPIGEYTDATPVFSDQKIYIRGNNNLFCIAAD
jgi:outer membrane protein assembly factor BamB